MVTENVDTICTNYTHPSLGLIIAVSVRRREQSCLRESTIGARGSSQGARYSTEGAGWRREEALKEYKGASRRNGL